MSDHRKAPYSAFPIFISSDILERYPTIQEDILKRYPTIQDRVVSGNRAFWPWVWIWAAWLSDCEWNKDEKTLFLSRKVLDRISLPEISIENMVDRVDRGDFGGHVMVIQSDTTGVWYPFIYVKEPLSQHYLIFNSWDYTCPVDRLILER